MRFRSLYRYSLSKSPADLRPAVVACKLTLVLAIVASVLFLAGLISFLYHQHYRPIGQQNHSSESSGDTSNTTTSSSSTTFARQQAESSTHSSSSAPSRPSLAQYIVDYSVPLCLALGAILSLLTLAAITVAYVAYRRYLQSRLASYQLVNRSFDQLQLEQLAKVHVRQPIITKQNGATVLVPKTSPVPEWLQQADNSNKSNKFANWARSKWTKSSRQDNNNTANVMRQVPSKKDMTI